ncbi:glycosyl hydrolase family 95 catalytic domain-containing protein [Streptomyces sp. NPDC090306]|uniref:glycosyl hydrolase family 95 catalytic domain-containing protein n=1 Tax=Streptomyces sp. NPDC090306 TaxID=3365961 RepID=UPI0038279F19
MNTGPVHGTWEREPAARWEDAFLAGNGRHGALVLGDPCAERVIVTHHALVRPNGGEHARPPRLAPLLPSIRDRMLAGDLGAAADFTDGRPLQWVQPFHPAFAVRVDVSGGPGPAEGRPFRRSVDFATGVVRAETAGRCAEVFVSRADDVIVHRVTATDGTELDLGVALDHRLPGAPAELDVTQRALPTDGGAVLTLHARYPHSDRAYAGTTVVAVHGGSAEPAGAGGTPGAPPGLRVRGAARVLLLTRVRRGTGPQDTAADANALRALLAAHSWDGLLDRHLAPHRSAYERVSLDLRADPRERALPGSELLLKPRSPALLERLFAAGRYHLLSSGGLLPPRLTGLWTGDWDTAWSGAFTANANLNLQTASAVATGLPEVTAAQARLVAGQLDDWRTNARTIFGARGVVAPSHTDGESGLTYHFSPSHPLHLWTAGADWLLKPLVDHDETRGERDPRTAAALAETALFYEDFLTTAPDGRPAVVPSYSPENLPATTGAVDAAMDLSAARHALRTAAAYHPGGADAERWLALADRLPPHRVNPDGALAEWAPADIDDVYDHRHLSHLYGVWPLDEITPYDTPDLARAAHRALLLRGAEDGSAHGHLHRALIAARLRDAGLVGRALGRVLDGDYFHASLMSAHYPGRDVYNADAAHALPAVLVEALVQSTPTRLVLLPAPPPDCPEGGLRGIRTRFGATVDLGWNRGRARAVVRPTRDCRVELRTSSGARTLDLTAGEARVLLVEDAGHPHIPPPPMEGTPWHDTRSQEP